MGNTCTTNSPFEVLKKRNFEKAEQRLKQYTNSKRIPLEKLTQDPSKYLRPGDILSRNMGPMTGLEFAVCEFYIYEGYENGYHKLIEKFDMESDEPVKRITENNLDMLYNFRLVEDCRYPDTLDVAKFLLANHKLDAGFSKTHANSEHFVTFCLTRCTKFAHTSALPTIRALRDLSGTLSTAVTDAAKLGVHPIYMLGGDMSWKERMVKTAVPFGFDGEAIAQGKKIMIGAPSRNIWHYWLEFDALPSLHTLHQYESADPSEDNRIIKYHR